MIRLAGGAKELKIAVIAAGSVEPVGTFRSLIADFGLYGVEAERIRLLPIAVADDPLTPDCDESAWSKNGFSATVAASFTDCGLIFFSGGDQMRYRQTLLDEKGSDSPVLMTARRLYEQGAVIAGTSAGAAMMCDPMIVSGTSLGALIGSERDRVRWDRGLGFWPGFIVDQHFIKRGRFGRLLVMLLQQDVHPGIGLGFGVDEDTALLVHGGQVRVIGRSGVLMVDTRRVVVEGTFPGQRIRGAVIHYLHHGDAYRPDEEEFIIHPLRKTGVLGREYYENYPASSDVFGRDRLLELIAQGLADCRQQEIYGLGFDPAAPSPIPAVRIRLFKTEATRSFLGSVAGEETVSILGLGLEIDPVRVRIEPLP